MENTDLPNVRESKQMKKLSQVRPGMEVFDRLGNKVGMVDDIYGGEGEMGASQSVANSAATSQPAVATASQPSVVPVFQIPTGDPRMAELEVLGAADDLPREVRERLLQDGFIRIDAGLFRHRRFALSGQIARVDARRVSLSVNFDELIKH